MKAVPTSVNNITLEQFLKLNEITESKLSDFEKCIQIITYFTGIDAEEIPFERMGLSRYYKPNLTRLLKRADKLINSKRPNSFKDVLWIGNKRYRAILEATSLNANQFTALCTYAPNPEKNIVKALSVLIYKYPLFGKAAFNDNDIKDIEKALMKARVKDVYGILLFFCLVYEKLNEISPAYLMINQLEIEKAIQDLMQEDTLNSKKNTDGITS